MAQIIRILVFTTRQKFVRFSARKDLSMSTNISTFLIERIGEWRGGGSPGNLLIGSESIGAGIES